MITCTGSNFIKITKAVSNKIARCGLTEGFQKIHGETWLCEERNKLLRGDPEKNEENLLQVEGQDDIIVLTTNSLLKKLRSKNRIMCDSTFKDWLIKVFL